MNSEKGQASTGTLQAVEMTARSLRRWQRTLYGCTLLAMATTILSVIVLLAAYNHEPKRTYFTLGKDGTMLKLVPQNLPNLTDAALQQWLTRALVDLFDYNFANYRRRLTETTSQYFTEEGRGPFIEELNSSGTFRDLEKGRYFVTLSIDNPPLMVRRGVDPDPRRRGVFRWIMQVPATMHIQSETRPRSFRLAFHVIVERISVRSRPEGVGIRSLVMETQA